MDATSRVEYCVHMQIGSAVNVRHSALGVTFGSSLLGHVMSLDLYSRVIFFIKLCWPLSYGLVQ